MSVLSPASKLGKCPIAISTVTLSWQTSGHLQISPFSFILIIALNRVCGTPYSEESTTLLSISYSSSNSFFRISNTVSNSCL